MITLLRRIRQRLLKTGGFGRYLLYATGEIALVVIGILIALQVNNWNVQRSQAELADQYLDEFAFNFKKDLELIDSVIAFNTLKIERLYTSMEYYFRWEEEARFRDSLAIRVRDGYIGNTELFQSNKTALDALLGSGNLNILPKDFRIKITEYYDAALQSEQEHERALMLTRDAIQDKMLKRVIKRNDIVRSFNLDIAPVTEEVALSEADLSIVIDMVFLAFIEAERVNNLLKLKQKAEELIVLIEN